VDVVAREPADETLAKTDDFVVTFEDRLFPHAVAGTAIVFCDDDIHGNVAQLASEVAGISGLQRCIRQTLTCTVRGDEVFQNRETFAEGRQNRPLDDFAGRLGHESTGSAQLTDLLFVTARTRVHHDVDRVYFGATLVVFQF
jgi:hypothetical protein